MEYYMQRAATLQSESERLLAGARDLEESIGVSLSARRFEAGRPPLPSSQHAPTTPPRLEMGVQNGIAASGATRGVLACVDGEKIGEGG